MLKLIKCEFWKLKRKRLLYALMSLSLFFPLILAYMAKAGISADTTEHYLQTRFDYVYTMMLGYGLAFLLPFYHVYMGLKNAFFGVPTTSPVYYAGAIGAIILLFILVEAAFRKEMGKEG